MAKYYTDCSRRNFGRFGIKKSFCTFYGLALTSKPNLVFKLLENHTFDKKLDGLLLKLGIFGYFISSLGCFPYFLQSHFNPCISKVT